MDDKSTESEALLHSSVVEDRLQAVRALSTQQPLPLERFCQAFGDHDWRVRKEAVRIFLSNPGARDHVPEIIGLLYDSENAGLRNSSIEILINLGSLAVDDLAGQASCGDPEVRKFIIDILGEIGHPGCIETIIRSLADEDTNVRYAAVETLGKLAEKKAVEPLLDLMDRADTGLQFTILEALALIGGDIPVGRLSQFLDEPVLRKAVLECFGQIGSIDVLPFLVDALSDPLRKVRDTALKSLGRLAVSQPAEVKSALSAAPDDLAERLVGMLDDKEQKNQQLAIRLAALAGNDQVVESMLPLLEDERLRDEVVTAFRALGEEHFAELLGLPHLNEPPASLYLLYLSGELHSHAGLPLAIASLAKSDLQQRYTAVVTLGKIGHASAIEPLAGMLDDENSDIRDAAAAALAGFSPAHHAAIASAVSPLLKLADADLRMRAVRVLGGVAGPTVEAALLMALKDADAGVRCEAIKALRGSSSAAYVEGLKLALGDELAEVRRLSAEALGDCEEEQALPALALAAEDQDPWVRAASLRSLRALSPDKVAPILMSAISDPVGLVVIAALEVLAEGSSADAFRPFLERALLHTDAEVVKAAIDLSARHELWRLSTEQVEQLLEHAAHDVRIHAIQTVTRLCGRDCLPQLERRLPIEENSLVRQVLDESIQQLLRSGN